ncbi:50S ribosomal protein L23 [Candidatus Saccharibacteria bacterium 32-49-12]|nr:MAG: 50S ribosomal protein L23 [Candidatus Saccharibacteria bacterium 32-49-12]
MTTTFVVTPVTTEKAYGQSQKNVYVFSAPLVANKQQIAEAIESQYGVKVAGIKTLVQSGKAIRFSRGKNRYPGTTNRTDSKKAYVTLAEGSISVFEQATEEEKK